jgi:hypothetical protein
LNALALIAMAATISFGGSLESQPKPGACQQDEAENQVAGGDINGKRHPVNGAPVWGRQITLYKLVIGTAL